MVRDMLAAHLETHPLFDRVTVWGGGRLDQGHVGLETASRLQSRVTGERSCLLVVVQTRCSCGADGTGMAGEGHATNRKASEALHLDTCLLVRDVCAVSIDTAVRISSALASSRQQTV